MAVATNGMALYRGIIPYSGTFLVFSDYCRRATRQGWDAVIGVRRRFHRHDAVRDACARRGSVEALEIAAEKVAEAVFGKFVEVAVAWIDPAFHPLVEKEEHRRP